VGTSDADIFQVHQLMLDDEDYLAAVRYIIETQSATAEYAVWATGENFASAFSAIEDSDMQSREADVRDVSNRVADILTGRKAERPFPDDSFILAVDDLTPSQAVQLDHGAATHGEILAGLHGNAEHRNLLKSFLRPVLLTAPV